MHVTEKRAMFSYGSAFFCARFVTPFIWVQICGKYGVFLGSGSFVFWVLICACLSLNITEQPIFLIQCRMCVNVYMRR